MFNISSGKLSTPQGEHPLFAKAMRREKWALREGTKAQLIFDSSKFPQAQELAMHSHVQRADDRLPFC